MEYKIGDNVTYIPKMEHGIVKSISDESNVFVVFHCGDDWGNYTNYTAARTRIEDLTKGWIKHHINKNEEKA